MESQTSVLGKRKFNEAFENDVCKKDDYEKITFDKLENTFKNIDTKLKEIEKQLLQIAIENNFIN